MPTDNSTRRKERRGKKKKRGNGRSGPRAGGAKATPNVDAKPNVQIGKTPTTLPPSSTNGPTLNQITGGMSRTYSHHDIGSLSTPQYSAKTFKILSIDGGGARGMIPAVILKELEKRSGRRISDMFDRVCGTSTGSILACGLTAPESAGASNPMFRAREIVEIYRTLGEEIFSRGSFNETVVEPIEELLGRTPTWIATHAGQAIDTVNDAWYKLTHPLHDINKLAHVLHGYLGDLKMKDALTELFVYAYDIGSRTPEIIGSQDSSIPGTRKYNNFRMFQAATASSAAAPFFAPYTMWKTPNDPLFVDMPPFVPDLYPESGGSGDSYDMVDGGNAGLGNPSVMAMVEESDASAGLNKMVLSMGTGHFSQPVSNDAKSWGFVQWLGEGGELLKSIFDGEADVADMALRQLLTKDESYFRWQPSIPESLAFLDEGSREDMDALEDVANSYIAEIDEDIDKVLEILTAPELVTVNG